MDSSNKKDSKAAKEISQMAKTSGITIREFSKHDLNMLVDNRPHQGFVLRAEPLKFTHLTHLDAIDKYSSVGPSELRCIAAYELLSQVR